ncbi:glycosyltransferase family 2 protein [Escherichia coli]|uniref:glycosyltransferase family 2 protein n=2 Tax=Enterobacteriaceae TaxID=543 RepID=UPI002417FFBD|nr:hypothetical protein [Escherichia coli]
MHPLVHVILVLNSGCNGFNSDFLNLERLFVYDFNKNLGYMQGASEGIKAYLKSNDLPDWIVLSNTDITFSDNCFFERLSNDGRKNIIIAPNIISADGVHQNPFLKHRLTLKKLKFLIAVNSFKFTAVAYSYLAKLKTLIKANNKKKPSSPLEIYAPHGAFIIIGSLYFSKGENLDHPTFLYGEELFIAERAARLGMKVIYDDRYQVLHAEHITTSKMTSEFRAKTLKESLISFIKYYY